MNNYLKYKQDMINAILDLNKEDLSRDYLEKFCS